MTVKELMEFLSKVDPDKEVRLYNGEYECTESVMEAVVDVDGDVVLV